MPVKTNWVQFQFCAKQFSSILSMKKIFCSSFLFVRAKSWSTWSYWVQMPDLMSWVRFRLFQTLFLFPVWGKSVIPVPLCPRKTANPDRIFWSLWGLNAGSDEIFRQKIWSSEFLTLRRFEYDQIQMTMSPGPGFDARELLRLFQCGRKKIECQNGCSIYSLRNFFVHLLLLRTTKTFNERFWLKCWVY